MVSHLDFQTGLQHLAHQPGQQTVLASQLDTVGAGPGHQLGRPVPHRRLITHQRHATHRRHRHRLACYLSHRSDPLRPTLFSRGPSDHAAYTALRTVPSPAEAKLASASEASRYLRPSGTTERPRPRIRYPVCSTGGRHAREGRRAGATARTTPNAESGRAAFGRPVRCASAEGERSVDSARAIGAASTSGAESGALALVTETVGRPANSVTKAESCSRQNDGAGAVVLHRMLGSSNRPTLGAAGGPLAPNVSRVSAGSASDEGGDDGCGVPIEGLAATVVAHRRAWVGVAGRFLHVTQRHAGIQGGGDEGVPQGVRSDSFADLGSAGDASHDPPGGVAIQPQRGAVGAFGQPAGYANGRTLDRAGRVVTRQHGFRRVVRTEHDDSETVLASHHGADGSTAPTTSSSGPTGRSGSPIPATASTVTTRPSGGRRGRRMSRVSHRPVGRRPHRRRRLRTAQRPRVQRRRATAVRHRHPPRTHPAVRRR